MSNVQKKNYTNVFDEKTRARLARESQQTAKGLSTLKTEIIRKGNLKLLQEERYKNGKSEINEEIHLAEKSKEIEAAKEDDKRSRLTKMSKLRNEKQRTEACLKQYKRHKFFTSLLKLKTTLANQEWNRTCHLKERILIREKLRSEYITRIRWKYKIDNIVPPNSIVFDKIIKYKREKRKRIKLQKERMIQIVQKIAREMKQEKQKPLKKAEFKKIKEESSEEFSREEGYYSESLSNFVEEDFPTMNKFEKIEEPKHEFEQVMENENDTETKEKHQVFGEAMLIKKSKSSTTEAFPSDVCFFANPSVVTFNDFKLDETYTRRVIITNKTTKWAYLRFNKVFTETWEPVVEIDTMDAARVKPGLHVTMNVKFSPVHDEKVIAEISFLTFNPNNPETFHELRVPVFCTPANPEPVLYPTEVRFPTAPIWRYNDTKFKERTLTIANEGLKSFSILIGKRNDRKDCFLWFFDEVDAQSVQPSLSQIDENENEECNVENSIKSSSKDTPRKMFQIEVPPKLKCQLRITFRPRYIGLHHEVIKISFSSDEGIFEKQDVPVWAKVIGSQIHLDPPCIDLGIAMIDSDVCQQSFNIVNTGRSSVQVSTKTPKCLGNQVTVQPKSTIVQPETFSTVSLRLIPKSTILRLSKRFYDPKSSMLEFPVHVQTMSRDAEKPPPIVLKILASLTTCRGLILEPANIDLGYVHTHESVYTELTLTNDSLLIQEYGFVNLPPFMEVQPNHGFGSILPGEAIKLHLVYSGCLTDIPGNEIGLNGLTGEQRFQVRVVTLAELAGNKKEIKMSEVKNLYDTRSTFQRRNDLLPIMIDTPEVMITSDRNAIDFKNSNEYEDSDFSVEENNADTQESVNTSIKLHHRGRRKEKNVINILVYIVDTFCEISEQILEFPATPCGSFSMVSVHLRGFNMASYPHCTCGILKNQEKEFTARYEFKCSSNRVKVAPQRGLLHSKHIVKVYFIFEPSLQDIEENEETKTNIEEQEKSKKDNESKRNGKGRNSKTAETHEKMSNVEKLPEEIILLETFEPRVSTIFATCAIDLETQDGARRKELLFAKLICPITRPEIVILNKNRKINFGPTAISTSSRKFLLVKNISNKNVKVDVSVLDPFGPFFVPPGKTIETGTVLSLPVTYRPIQDGEEEESFEVFSSRTRTRWRVKITGRGVVPSYTIKPRFRVARFEVIDDKPVELNITIQNTGMCPLIFRLRVIDAFQGNIPRAAEESLKKPSKKKKNGMVDGESGRKTPRMPEFSDVLRCHEELAIFGGELERSVDPCFSFRNLDESMQLLAPERKRVEFGIRFQRPSAEGIFEKGKAAEMASTKRKKKKEPPKENDAEKLNYCHVAVLELTLGNSTFVQDLVMIYSLK